MCCTTKSNIMILFEIVLVKSNLIYADVKYKSESSLRETDFENFLSMILSDVEVEEESEMACR